MLWYPAPVYRARQTLLFLLRFKGDDNVGLGLIAKRLHCVFLLNGGCRGFEGHFLGAFFFAGFNGDGLCVNPFKFCKRLTDVLFTAASCYARHAHQIFGGRLFLCQSDADKQHGKDRSQNVYEFHLWLVLGSGGFRPRPKTYDSQPRGIFQNFLRCPGEKFSPAGSRCAKRSE